MTAGNTIEFVGDEAVHFDAWGLSAQDVLSFDRCGPGCNSAKNVFELRGSRARFPQSQSAFLSEPGKYYFWVRRTNDDGETGPLPIGAARQQGDGFRAQFGDDVHVLVRVTGGTEAVPPPADPPPELVSEQAAN